MVLLARMVSARAPPTDVEQFYSQDRQVPRPVGERLVGPRVRPVVTDKCYEFNY